MEVWKKIEDFENYEVSNYGNVRRNKSIVNYKNGLICNHKERYLKFENINTNKKGLSYKRVTLSNKNKTKRFSVHRLVAIYFLNNKENKLCVNHIDGNPSNNNVSNLEWCTHSENETHSYDILKKINPIRKLEEEDILLIREKGVLGRGGNVMALANYYQVNKTTILNVLKNRYYVKVT